MARTRGEIKFSQPKPTDTAVNEGKAAGELLAPALPFPLVAKPEPAKECGTFEIGCKVESGITAVKSFLIKAAFFGIAGYLAFVFLESFLSAKGAKAGGK